MKKYECVFTVVGCGSLPIDMMRYDRCTPHTQEDASKVANSFMNYKPTEERTIHLHCYMETAGKNPGDHPTTRRWNSFGWKVINVEWRKLA